MSFSVSAVAAPQVLGCEDHSPTTAKWLKLLVLKCKDESGREYNWEYVERVTKYRETDGVAVFARVVAKDQPDRLLVIAQWRAPLDTFVLELPAGIIEKGETIEQVAVRELQEETGYTGVLESVTPEAPNDQGLTNSCLNFGFATVDAAAPENANPQPSPELGETLQVLLLPIKGLAGTLLQLKAQHSWAIDSRLLAFALGLDYAASISSNPASSN
uniref:Nudix hydrolase domain-containing protein n=1 Tax=Tetradesmus obliquus TaxID=3088 RepID=A0A383VNF6_TETOB|eukprot:jgi/Sobl393_1/16560/SZX66430.1